MDLEEYQKNAMRSVRIESKMIGHGSLSDESIAKVILGVMGLSGEVGEVVEPIKKWFFHGKHSETDVRAMVKEELGDVLWYVACLADGFNLSLNEIAAMNIDKLSKRYPERKENGRD